MYFLYLNILYENIKSYGRKRSKGISQGVFQYHDRQIILLSDKISKNHDM